MWIRYEVARLIAAADPDVLANGKVTILSVRKTIKVRSGECHKSASHKCYSMQLLLDRNLLQGSVQGGFKMHVRIVLLCFLDYSFDVC